MAKKTITPTLEQLASTTNVTILRTELKNDIALAEMIGISKVTLYTRLKLDNWKKSEMALIKTLKT